jgi:hypothetical protein
MDMLINIAGWVLTLLGVLVVVLGGIAGGLRLLAPKTTSTLDDRALGFVDKAVAALKWVEQKLLSLLGLAAGGLARKPPAP